MEHYNSLVAGGDEQGFQDGAYYQARFDKPTGLCFDPTATRLFVADRDNNRIRLIHLDDKNRVETLAGTGAPGNDDGPLASASFMHPQCVAFIPPDSLAVFDQGSSHLRIIDLQAGLVSTLPGGPIGGVWSLAYDTTDGGLYCSEPWEGKVLRLDWASKAVVPVLTGDSRVPHPKALCFYQDHLYLADQDLPTVYRMDVKAPAPAPVSVSASAAQAPSPAPGYGVDLIAAGQGAGIKELAGAGGPLYAFEAGVSPVAQILPVSQAVPLATPFEFLMNNGDSALEPLLRATDSPAGFAVSPAEDHKLFIAGPSDGFDNIISVKDYDFGSLWKGNANYNDPTPDGVLCDFNYPQAKPRNTFRILVLGDSHVLLAPSVIMESATVPFDAYQWTVNSVRNDSFPKQLELLLNTEGVLRDSPEHYEVLTLAAHGWGPSSWVYDVVPAFVQRYDIDLVLVLAGVSGYEDYYTKPLRPEGIPTFQRDLEYAAEPMSAHIPPGVPARFYRACVSKGIFQGKGLPLWDEVLAKCDPAMRADLMELTARPLRLFAAKMKTLRVSSGVAPKLGFLYLPSRWWLHEDECRSFWDDLCAENGLEMMDLLDPFNALKTSYYPSNEACCAQHYTAGGNALIARLLDYYLLKQGWVP